jgi:hypothetical protein
MQHHSNHAMYLGKKIVTPKKDINSHACFECDMASLLLISLDLDHRICEMCKFTCTKEKCVEWDMSIPMTNEGEPHGNLIVNVGTLSHMDHKCASWAGGPVTYNYFNEF